MVVTQQTTSQPSGAGQDSNSDWEFFKRLVAANTQIVTM